MQVLKQRTACALLPKRKRSTSRQRNLFGDEPRHRAFWQARFYDFNVWTTKKHVQKLRYMHRNPVKRGLVESPEQWRWSSYRFHLLEEAGRVRVNEGWTEISFRDRAAQAAPLQALVVPTLRKVREGRGTHRVADGSEIRSLSHPPLLGRFQLDSPLKPRPGLSRPLA